MEGREGSETQLPSVNRYLAKQYLVRPYQEEKSQESRDTAQTVVRQEHAESWTSADYKVMKQTPGRQTALPTEVGNRGLL